MFNLEPLLNCTVNEFWRNLENWIVWNGKKKARYTQNVFEGLPRSIEEIVALKNMREELEYLTLETYLRTHNLTKKTFIALLKRNTSNKQAIKDIKDAYSIYVPDIEIVKMVLALIEESDEVFIERIKREFSKMVSDREKFKFIHLVLG